MGPVADAPIDLAGVRENDANNHSVVLRIDFGTSSFLTSGDLEVEAIEELIKKHGQTTSSTRTCGR